MAVEIERKFLVNKLSWNTVEKMNGVIYQQGYLSTEAAKTIRVRTGGGKGYLTIKGSNKGLSRVEFEYEIPLNDALELLEKFCHFTISKTRYRILVAEKIWEVDEFWGDNEGLMLAEIELSTEEEKFTLPEWIDKEVTFDNRYYNSNLAMHPYKTWQK